MPENIECAEILSRQVYLIGQPETPRMWLKVSINDKRFRGLLDSGAVKNMIHSI